MVALHKTLSHSIAKVCIKTYDIGIGRVENDVLYLKYGSNSKINTVKRYKTHIGVNP